jgi:hypothetical protein
MPFLNLLGAPPSRRLTFPHYNHCSPITTQAAAVLWLHSEITGIRFCEPAGRRRSQGAELCENTKSMRHAARRRVYLAPMRAIETPGTSIWNNRSRVIAELQFDRMRIQIILILEIGLIVLPNIMIYKRDGNYQGYRIAPILRDDIQ